MCTVEDYAKNCRTRSDGTWERIGLPKSNMLRFLLEKGAWVVVRPSGTEPKLKLYIGANDASEAALERQLAALFDACDGMLRERLGL